MSDKSAIEWTDATWNPATGCSKVSAGCAHCYAETFAERFKGVKGHHFEQGFALKLWPDRLKIPLEWKVPRKIFVNSMSDLFHEDIPDDFIRQVFGVMALAPRHTFQVLTKRPARALEWFGKQTGRAVDLLTGQEACDLVGPLDWGESALIPDEPPTWPLPNVWLGVSVENQRAADERIPQLLRLPAAVRFLSCEPLLGPVTFRPTASSPADMVRLSFHEEVQGGPMDGAPAGAFPAMLKGLDWVIVGGESGPEARAMDPLWAREVKTACAAARVPFFMKQMGGQRDKRGKIEDLPQDLRVREFPGFKRA